VKLEKRSEGSMQELVAAVAGPREWGDTRQSWIARAARRAGISFRQAKSIFYGEITDPEHKAVRRLRDFITASEEKAVRDERNEFRARLARLEAALLSTDPDFHRETLAVLRQQAGGPSRNGSALDSGE
jgi:hypothetical protein